MADADAAKWKALAAIFPTDQVEKLPKQVSKNDTTKAKCVRGSNVSADGYFCDGYHAKSIHLDYIGHAGITMRLNSVDPTWTWEPMALTEAGTPLFADGGMWIRMTVLGVTRLGFGDAGGKSPGPNAVKEIIGDAIRNAAMRFGVGTYLWSKSDEADLMKKGIEPEPPAPPAPPTPSQEASVVAEKSGLFKSFEEYKEFAMEAAQTDKVNDLTEEEAKNIINAIKDNLNQKGNN